MGAFDIQTVCRNYDIGTSKVYELINTGTFDARKFGRKTLISRESVEAWFAGLPRGTAGLSANGQHCPPHRGPRSKPYAPRLTVKAGEREHAAA